MLTAAVVRRALVALLLAVPLVAAGGTAQAAACSGSTGVTVIVQFPDGHTETGCAPGDPASGTSALSSAGFPWTPVRGQGFVCQIKSLPSSTCNHTPPSNAYWAYFHAKRGGSWSYSSEGATSYDPAPGSVEGWRFGNGAKPSTAPPAAAPKPKPTPKPSTKPTASSPTAAASASPSGTTTAAAKATKARAAKAKAKAGKAKAAKAKAAKSAAAEVKASVSATPSPSAGVAAPVDQSSPQADQGGGNVPWLWGLVGLVVVGGAAGAVTLVRRH